jgi:HSP20 family molecular chaperone IbpA
MGIFDENDPFNDIVKEFFGQHPGMRRYRGQANRNEKEDRTADVIENDNSVFLIFELPGYDEEEVSVEVKDRVLEIIAKKSSREGVQDYLHQKLRRGVSLRRQLSSFINSKKFSHTMRNGVLEIMFEKTKGGKAP